MKYRHNDSWQHEQQQFIFLSSDAFFKVQKYLLVMDVVMSYMLTWATHRQCRRIIYCIMAIKVDK